MNENNLNSELKENTNENNKKTSLNSIYKILISIFMILLLVSGIILFKNYITTNKEKVEVVSLSESNINNNEIFNINKYVKEGLSVVDIKGEYGGGRNSLDNGNYINYSYYSDNKVLIELYNNDNSLIFDTMINLKEYEDVSVYDVYILEDNKIILSVYGTGDKNKTYTTLITLDTNGKILSEFVVKDKACILHADSTNGIIVSIFGEHYSYNKIIKFDSQNKKVFEYNFEQALYRVFFDENKIIAFTYSYKNKTEGITLHIIDEKGKEIFSKNNTNFNYDTLGSITQLSDGNFLIQEMQCINQKNYDGYKLKSIVKIDSEFNEMWRKDINKSYDFFDIIELNNEYFVYMQETYSIEDKSQTKISSFTKIDSSGNIVWCKYFGYDKNDEFNIINNNQIHTDVPLYIQDEKIIFKGSVFENNVSTGYVNISIDSLGNIH